MSAIQSFLQRADNFFSRLIARLPPPFDNLRVRLRLQAGVTIALIASFVVLLLLVSNLLGALDRLATDFLYNPILPQPRIAVIAIDKKSLDEIGTFPWSRAIHAELLERLAQAPPRVIAYDVVFTQESSQDEVFVKAIQKSGNVLLAATTASESALPPEMNSLPAYAQLITPAPLLLQAASRVAHRVIVPDSDGITRQIPTGIQSANETYPALGLAAVAQYLDAPAMQFDLGARTVRFDSKEIPTDEFGNTLLNFTSPTSTFDTYSFVDVLSGAVPPETFAGRLVFIGGNSTIESEQYAIPLQLGTQRTHNVNLQADLANMFLTTPPQTLQRQGVLGQLAMILGAALLVGFTVPHVRVLYGVALTIVYLVALLLFAFDAFNHGFVIPIFYPALALLLTSVSIIAFRYFSEDRRRRFLTLLFRRYVPAETLSRVVDAADRGELPLMGTRRLVTVLYADLRGFAIISEEMTAELVLRTVNQYMELALQAISTQGGTVSKPMGDALIAIWNAPLDQADHCVRALHAAIEIRRNLLQFQKNNPAQEKFSVGIGLTTGWAVLGNISAQGKTEYTLVGDTVNVAARISAFANNNQILADTTTASAASSEIIVRELSPVRVRGRKEPLPVWEVRDATPTIVNEEEE